MHYTRAKEIIQSPHNIRVLYRGDPVWINNLNSSSKTAEVILEDNHKIDVPVEDLVEAGILTH